MNSTPRPANNPPPGIDEERFRAFVEQPPPSSIFTDSALTSTGHDAPRDSQEYIRTYIGAGGAVIPPENVTIDQQTGWLYDKSTIGSAASVRLAAPSVASTDPARSSPPLLASPSIPHPAIGTLPRDSAARTSNSSLAFAARKDREDNEKDYFHLASEYISNSGNHESRLRRIFGFSPEEIIAGGALSCAPCRESSLCQPLRLTLFRRGNFENITDEIYQTLLPALRLAERLILHPDTFPFWGAVALGPRIRDDAESLKVGLWRETLLPLPPMSQQDFELHYCRTVAYLNSLGENLTIQFQKTRSNAYAESIGATYWAESWCLTKRQLGTREGITSRTCKDNETSGILLHSDFREIATRLRWIKNHDIAQVLRFNFLFAFLLCHEVAHALEHEHGPRRWSETKAQEIAQTQATNTVPSPALHLPRTIGPPYGDPITGPGPGGEIGIAWELSVFGRRVFPINGELDCRLGLAAYHGPNVDGPYLDLQQNFANGQYFGSTVPMGFIEEIQQESFWARPGKKNLSIPLTNTISWISTRAMTTDWIPHLVQRDLHLFDSFANSMRQSLPNLGSDSLLPRPVSGNSLKRSTSHPDQTPEERQSKRRDIKDFTGRSIRSSTMSQRPKAGPKPLLQPKLTSFLTSSRLGSLAPKSVLIERLELRNTAKAEAEQQARSQAAKTAARAVAHMAYFAPTPDQSNLRQYFPTQGQYADNAFTTGNSSSSSSGHGKPGAYKDPVLTSDPATLTYKEKWTLLEELYFFETRGGSAQQLHARWEQSFAYGCPAEYNPMLDESWKQPQLNRILAFRQQFPQASLPERTKAENEAKARKAARVRIELKMEELIVRLGFSRIDFQHDFAEGKPLWNGMTVETFVSGGFDKLLKALRIIERVGSSEAYKNSVQRGLIVNGPVDVSQIASNHTPNTNNAGARLVADFNRLEALNQPPPKDGQRTLQEVWNPPQRYGKIPGFTVVASDSSSSPDEAALNKTLAHKAARTWRRQRREARKTAAAAELASAHDVNPFASGAPAHTRENPFAHVRKHTHDPVASGDPVDTPVPSIAPLAPAPAPATPTTATPTATSTPHQTDDTGPDITPPHLIAVYNEWLTASVRSDGGRDYRTLPGGQLSMDQLVAGQLGLSLRATGPEIMARMRELGGGGVRGVVNAKGRGRERGRGRR